MQPDPSRKYLTIVSHYEARLAEHGDTFRGVDYPRATDPPSCYQVMLELIKPHESAVSLLDFGCGASHLYEYILAQKISGIEYSGLDLSAKFLEVSRRKFPAVKYYQADLLTDSVELPQFDYVVMAGVCTEKLSLSYEEMLEYFQALVKRVFQQARIGIAFNVMSKHVDWERDDLLHLPLDTAAAFVVKHLSRYFVVRHDYGLYQYTVYVYKQPGIQT